jgi:AcrR family transcriptional regulator
LAQKKKVVNKKKKPADRLSRKRILEAAIEFADENGIGKLNMRTLATQLDSAVMSLYTYVQNKDELLDGMVDVVAAEIIIPTEDQHWRDAITDIALSAFRTFYRHAWVNSLWSTAASPAKMEHQESILRVFRRAGFTVKLSCRGYHAITMHTIGFTMQALDFPRGSKSMKAAARTFLSDADPKRIPYFIEHVKYHQAHPEPDGEFEFVLDMILDGLETLLEDA